MKKVLILGCGPSGLLAAHAVAMAGGIPTIVSRARASQLFGCQYLHRAIPGFSGRGPETVRYKLRGTPEEYAEKVYGPEMHPSLRVSPQTLAKDHEAWDIRQAYRELWAEYSRFIVQDVQLMPDDIEPMLKYYSPDAAITTIPAPVLCSNPEHDFRSVRCYAIGDAPELGQFAPPIAEPFTVLCDSTKDVGFYRASNVFGYNTVEWPGWRSKPPVSGIVDFLKPLSTNCDCWPQLERRGRMARWTKGVLAHDAFGETLELMGFDGNWS